MTKKVQRTVFRAMLAATLAAAALPVVASDTVGATLATVVATGTARGESAIRAPLSIVVYPGDEQVRRQLGAADVVADPARVFETHATATTAQR
jgi:hypothetical protein